VGTLPEHRKLALEGQIGAIQEIADRTEGKPPQAIALSGDMELTMTIEEIDARPIELTEQARARR